MGSGSEFQIVGAANENIYGHISSILLMVLTGSSLLEVEELNSFTPEPPVQILVPSTACDIINFNVQGQICPLMCAE